MPKFKCPIPACTFETDDLDPVIMAALVTAHAKVHDTTMTPAKVDPPVFSWKGRAGQGKVLWDGKSKV